MLPNQESEPQKNQHIKPALIFTIISAFVFVLLGVFGLIFINNDNGFKPADTDFKKFASETELREYIANSAQNYGFAGFGGARDLAINMETSAQEVLAPSLDSKRVSETNVQVTGIDEPDIVKTDGQNIFFSSENMVYYDLPVEPLILEQKMMPTEPGFVPPTYQAPNTKVVNALPPTAISLASEVEANGELLLANDKLLVFSYDRVKAFDVSDPKNPTLSWEEKFDENFGYLTARLLDGKAYVIARRYANFDFPCPVPLFDGGLTIACTDIYRPSQPISTDSVYSVIKLDPSTGNVEKTTTFVGGNNSVIYVSPDAIYASFTMYPNMLAFTANFLSENQDLIPSSVVLKINNLVSLDISQESKNNELNVIIQRFLATLSNDERTRVESELSNRMNDYLVNHGRELQTTKIVKINKDLEVVATGDVPGAPLNQFSLDEYNGELRVATTLSASTMFGRGESANDLYVLDSSLKVKGQIQGLALGERIYSARFIGERAYLVTFKQIDPFFVIDLSDSSNPRVAGELKIPGFSSYLHPLSDNRILGVGQENSQVKLSVFDVSNAQNPTEVDKYLLDEFWTEFQNNHHAFLADPDNKVFFIPAGGNGYIFDYADTLALRRAVSDVTAKRALYIDNYLYIIGEQEVVVLNMSNWEEVSNLEF